jgi:hypothetical protein
MQELDSYFPDHSNGYEKVRIMISHSNEQKKKTVNNHEDILV